MILSAPPARPPSFFFGVEEKGSRLLFNATALSSCVYEHT